MPILETALFLAYCGLGLHSARRLGDDDDGGFWGPGSGAGSPRSYPATPSPAPVAARPAPDHCGQPDGIRIACNRNRQFEARCELSDGRARDVAADMLVDTGATTTTLAHPQARALGVDLGRLRYHQSVITASGREYAGEFVIPELRVYDTSGEFALTLYDVTAHVFQRDVFSGGVLGMNALCQVSATFENDELVLRA
jgi:clan AA aspartic protease (TIGR02281 family)